MDQKNWIPTIHKIKELPLIAYMTKKMNHVRLYNRGARMCSKVCKTNQKFPWSVDTHRPFEPQHAHKYLVYAKWNVQQREPAKPRPECHQVDQSAYFPGGSDDCSESGMWGVNVHVSRALRLSMQYKGVITFMDFVNDAYSLSQDCSAQLFFTGQIVAELLHQL